MEGIVGIIIILLIVYLFSRKDKSVKRKPVTRPLYSASHYQRKSKNHPTEAPVVKQLLTAINNTAKDDSIIDVSNETFKITIDKGETGDVPYWEHFYVYSYNDLERANEKQKEFYARFKVAFLNESFPDLKGNSNYAFILFYDLLNDFGRMKKDLLQLEYWYKKLAIHYPVTKRYCKNNLLKAFGAHLDYDGISRINNDDFYLSSSGHYNEYQRTGDKYKKRLELNGDQVNLLNKIYEPQNNFTNIEFCLLQVMRLYLEVVEKLRAGFSNAQSNMDAELTIISEEIATRHLHYRKGSYNFKYAIPQVTDDIYRLIYKYCENALREFCGHKRKLNTEVYYPATVKQLLEEKITGKLPGIMGEVIKEIPELDSFTEIALNEINTTRWKVPFEQLKKEYLDNKEINFYEAILKLGEENKRNPSIENIFFEASKFIAKADRKTALDLYVRSLYYDLISEKFDNRQFTKTAQKSLFKNNDELHEFERIITQLIKDKDLDHAVGSLPQVFAIKRKKIKLNAGLISEVKEKHSATVGLLDEILGDSYEDSVATITTKEINSNEVVLEIEPKVVATQGSSESVEVSSLSTVQKEVLELFAKSSFTVTTEDFENFARSRGMFKNQLAESINEACYERLDDLLIEEEDGNYIMQSQYYQTITRS